MDQPAAYAVNKHGKIIRPPTPPSSDDEHPPITFDTLQIESESDANSDNTEQPVVTNKGLRRPTPPSSDNEGPASNHGNHGFTDSDDAKSEFNLILPPVPDVEPTVQATTAPEVAASSATRSEKVKEKVPPVQAVTAPDVAASPATRSEKGKEKVPPANRASKQVFSTVSASSTFTSQDTEPPTHLETMKRMVVANNIIEALFEADFPNVELISWIFHEVSLGKTITCTSTVAGSDATTDTATSSRSTRRAPAADGWYKLRNLNGDKKKKIVELSRSWTPKTPATEIGTDRKITFRKVVGYFDEANNVVISNKLITKYADSDEEHIDRTEKSYAASSPFATRVFENTIENNTKKLQACGPKCVKVLFRDGPHEKKVSLEKL